MKIIEYYKKNPTNFALYLLLIIIGIIIAGVILVPSIFYDNWIWKYYWGPVIADSYNSASGTASHNGVITNEGYTMVSEITYGIILIFAIYLIYKLLKKLEIKVDWRFALVLMPYILYGPITRVLEDTGFFDEPFVYWFISPLIYLQTAFLAIFFLLIGYYFEKKFKITKINVNSVLFVGGFILLISSLIPIAQWLTGDRWGITTGIRFDIFELIIGIIISITGIIFAIGFIFRKNENIAKLKNPLNLAMIFGHLLDGITSYISIKDPLNMSFITYTEKHPASNVLLEIWGPLFPIVKFVLIIVVIYVFDILYKKELKNYVSLVNLIKIGILILGFSPGLRDLLRVTMGV
jgi:uncharacterized membrane protein